jgi:anti-sigma B factor antagonist
VQGHVSGQQTVDGLSVVSLAGELDLMTVPELRRQLVASSSAELPDLVVDLRDVLFMDCAVIGTLIAARRRVVAQGGCVRLAGLRERPRRLLQLCRLDEVFCVYDSLDPATKARCEKHQPAPPRAATVPAQTTRVAAVVDAPRANGAEENPAMS